MLTLFVPWRSGTDLRNPGEEWPSAWSRVAIGARYRAIISNINLKYECLDARDDFRAQLKSGADVNLPNASWFDPNDDDFEVPCDDQNGTTGSLSEIIEGSYRDGILAGDELGKCYGDRMNAMKRMAAVLNNTGWSKPVAVVHNEPVLNRTSAQYLPASGWRAEVMRKRQEVMESRSKAIPATVKDTPHGRTRIPSNAVFITDKRYLTKDPIYDPVIQRKIDVVVSAFGLNYEQEKAFRIVANHASDSYAERLNMYIGGMGGTGKSQVLKALMHFFKSRGESYRLIVVAPTGSAAALLGGMTYHSAFGINDRSGAGMAAVKSKLIGVDYVFFDEISMVSSFELYRISARLCRVLNTPDTSFGGLSMIFAGDFAQLPPPMGGEAASLYGRQVGLSGNTLRKQKASIGKSIWHEVTTVVILKQNMRQTAQSEDDAKLRMALENMRYKACTTNDIAFLRSRISSSLPGKASIRDPEFRNVSVITTLNVLKDTINGIGSARFAEETGQRLSFFYSEDEFVQQSDNSDRERIRNLVEVLPNFSMTDFASQGKTRQYNVVDLSPCKTHQSFYTALSRGVSAQGTVIVQEFSTQPITGGINGTMRDEFRSLEVLNVITDLRYNDLLPNTINGSHRRELIAQFRKWKGANHVPDGVHHAIKWSPSRPWVEDDHTQQEWAIIDNESNSASQDNASTTQSKFSNYISAEGSKSVPINEINPFMLERGANKEAKKQGQQEDSTTRKRIKVGPPTTITSCMPDMMAGIEWSNNSCAYDALLKELTEKPWNRASARLPSVAPRWRAYVTSGDRPCQRHPQKTFRWAVTPA
ncbi:hypothetical protein CC1G_14752 [Coprinopsis cinerea okayama7|uniref:ATP-dependent DNA helicase n=1 Tax=Coprinopsis cinerea (strain Okayama-7 / 130 / ATCC MYA-4618 / FGSC 9003) TaxID=240176 RepID=D6RNL5_COPC7|nr:hypothetical protein CC1G_14752 [Coprinopsis cinerea okayama7\|eukprot:XP_002910774.1 hypothetical protein CC1G_14752 [Coprinopsis cinerea okayama7\